MWLTGGGDGEWGELDFKDNKKDIKKFLIRI